VLLPEFEHVVDLVDGVAPVVKVCDIDVGLQVTVADIRYKLEITINAKITINITVFMCGFMVYSNSSLRLLSLSLIFLRV